MSLIHCYSHYLILELEVESNILISINDNFIETCIEPIFKCPTRIQMSYS